MLIIANGGFKSGSTWLFNILQEMTGYSSLPEDYQNSGWINPSIHPDKLAAALGEVDHLNRDSLVKNHFGKKEQRDLILKTPNVVVFDIHRSLSDVVVSSYYHFKNELGFTEDFPSFYWKHGRFIALSGEAYHRLWRLDSPQVYVSSFEELKTNFDEEVRRIAAAIGISLEEEDVDRIHKKTSLSALREKYNDSTFFREGGSGYESEYFDSRIKKDMDLIRKTDQDYSKKITKIKEKLRGILRRYSPFFDRG